MVKPRQHYAENAVQTSPLQGQEPRVAPPSMARPTQVAERQHRVPLLDAVQLIRNVELSATSPLFQPRIVSNPELQQSAEPVFTLPLQPPPLPIRSVSMPDAAQACMSAAITDQLSDSVNSHRTIIIHNDIPQTPSPPSSPDSVLFIEHSGKLPRHFLRGCSHVDSQDVEQSDDGWLSWGSPPRPIPALHGPASLPYARCPSGAEGTIIEEQSSLSCMIWGLDAKEQTNSHTTYFAPQHRHEASTQHYRRSSQTREHDRKPLRGQRHSFNDRHSMPMSLPTHSYGPPFIPSTSASTQSYPTAPSLYQSGSHDASTLDDDILFAHLRREASRKMDEQTRLNQSVPGTPDLLSLLNSGSPGANPVKYAANQMQMLPSGLPKRSLSTSHLPTPPNSTAPTFSSTFSPLPVASTQELIQRQLELLRTPVSPRRGMILGESPTSAELSDQLRRLVLGPLRTQAIREVQQCSARDSYMPDQLPGLLPSLPVSNQRASSLPTRAVSDPLAPNAAVAWESFNVSATGAKAVKSVGMQQQTAISTTPEAYRSSLTNPRSVPISRLRTTSKGSLPLPAVPEEPDNFLSGVWRRTAVLGASKQSLSRAGNPPVIQLPDESLQTLSQSRASDINLDDEKPRRARVRLPQAREGASATQDKVVHASTEEMSRVPRNGRVSAPSPKAAFQTPISKSEPTFSCVLTPPDDAPISHRKAAT